MMLPQNTGFLLAGLRTRHYVLLVVASFLVPHAQAGRVRAPKGYTLVWGDEFKGKNGSLPDSKKWTYDIGGNGWGNRELEYYTNRPENARIERGKLVITARGDVHGTGRQELQLHVGAFEDPGPVLAGLWAI